MKPYVLLIGLQFCIFCPCVCVMSAINTNTRVEFCYLIAVYTTWLLPNLDGKKTGMVWFLNAWQLFDGDGDANQGKGHKM